MAWFFLMFGISQFVADAQGRTGALGNQKIAGADPCSILFVDIAVRHIFFKLKYIFLSYVLCEDIRCFFNIINQRARGRESLKQRKDKHLSSHFDNLQTKIQVHFLTFIINISNDAVLAELGDKNISFKDISYKIKKEVNYQNCTKLKNSTIKDILENDISEKYKQFKRDFNVNTLNKVYNSSDWLNKFFNMKYLEMFEIYYSKGKPLKEFIFEGKKITLSKTTKTFYDLLNKKGNVEIQNKLKETARIAYLDGYDFLLGKKNSFKVIK